MRTQSGLGDMHARQVPCNPRKAYVDAIDVSPFQVASINPGGTMADTQKVVQMHVGGSGGIKDLPRTECPIDPTSRDRENSKWRHSSGISDRAQDLAKTH